MAYNPASVVSFGFPIDAFTFTYLISGTVDASADVGKAVALDTTAANTVKLTGDNDVIFGRLVSIENRDSLGFKTGAVQRRFKEKLPAAVGHGIAVGNVVSGSATAGVVKLATSQTTLHNQVIETGTDYVVVEKL
ncbi:MAG: hypothetical protein ACTHJR_16475 [Sphingomonas sp.]|uniref:hypothetical protein n=1 Tax=Sphingomonas sp. TaxID=28214 RepID=UPI003F80BA40